jgi:predicted nucleic acid-binding protein
VTPAQWLLHNSALSRLDHPEVQAVLVPRIDSGLVGVSIVTELEVGFSARSIDHYQTTRRSILDRLLAVSITPRAESRARQVQAALVSIAGTTDQREWLTCSLLRRRRQKGSP